MHAWVSLALCVLIPIQPSTCIHKEILCNHHDCILRSDGHLVLGHSYEITCAWCVNYMQLHEIEC